MQFTVRAGEVVLVEADVSNAATITSGGPSVLYYGASSSVSSASNDGNVTTGNNVTITTTKWVTSADRTNVDVAWVGETPSTPPDSSDPHSLRARLATNVKDYDTPALAILAAGTGGAVYWPADTYVTATDLTPLAGQVWHGPGTIQLVDDGSASSRTVHVTVDDFTIDGLTVTSTASSRTGSYGLIRASACAGLHVERCRLGVSPATGVHLLNCTGFYVGHNWIDGTYADGIHIQRQSTNGRVTGNDITNTGDDAIGVMSYRDSGTYTACAHIVVDGNIIHDIGASGIGRGVAVYGGLDVLVSGNQIVDVDAAGVDVGTDISASAADATPYGKAIKVAGNQIRNTGRHASASNKTGVTVSKTRGVELDGNQIDTTGAQGIVLSGVVLEADVTGNRVARSTGRGIVVSQTTSTDARLLSELYTDEGETAPGTAKCRVVRLVNNRVRKGSDGIAVIGTTGQRVEMLTVSGNSVRECSTEPIDLQFASNGTIVGNVVESSGSVIGIKIDQCDGFPVSGNTIIGTSVAVQGTDFDEGYITANVLNGGSAAVDGSSTATVGTNVA